MAPNAAFPLPRAAASLSASWRQALNVTGTVTPTEEFSIIASSRPPGGFKRLWPGLAMNVQKIQETSAQVGKLASGVWGKRRPFRHGLFFLIQTRPFSSGPSHSPQRRAGQLRSLELNDIAAPSTSQGGGGGGGGRPGCD